MTATKEETVEQTDRCPQCGLPIACGEPRFDGFPCLMPKGHKPGDHSKYGWACDCGIHDEAGQPEWSLFGGIKWRN